MVDRGPDGDALSALKQRLAAAEKALEQCRDAAMTRYTAGAIAACAAVEDLTNAAIRAQSTADTGE